MKDNFDYVISGASFVGLICAKLLSDYGYKVCIIEKQNREKFTTKTTGVMRLKNVEIIDSIPELKFLNIKNYILNHIDTIIIHIGKEKIILNGQRFVIIDVVPMLNNINRSLGNKVTELYDNQISSIVENRELSLILKNGLIIKTNMLIGAEGSISNVAKITKLDINNKFLIGFEKEYDFSNSNISSNTWNLIYNPKISKGYPVWITPRGKNMVIGFTTVEPKNMTLKYHEVLDYLSEYELKNMNYKKEITRRGGLIPINGPLKKTMKSNIILVGDSSGMCSAFKAEGIFNTIIDALAKSKALIKYSKSKNLNNMSKEIYKCYKNYRIIEHIHKEFILRKLFTFIDNTYIYNILKFAIKFKIVKYFFLNIFNLVLKR